MARQALRLRPVNSKKHIIDVASSTVLATLTSIPIIESNDAPGLGFPTQVLSGSTVNAIYLRVEVVANNQFSGVPRIYMSVYKDPGGNAGNPNPNGSGTDDKKRFILHQEMTMMAGTLSGTPNFPRTMFQGVVKIPSRLKRMGYGDRVRVLLQNGSGESTGIANVCIQCIYKEFI